jgi:glutaconate CoA-transferase subunit B
VRYRRFAEYSLPELMAVSAAREIRDGEKVFVGIGIPMIAAFLAIYDHAPNAVLFFEGGYIGGRPPSACTDVGDTELGFRAPYITSLWRTFSDLQHGYCDLAIIGGAQIDRHGNVNSTAIFGDGTYQEPKTRLAGSGGANDMVSSAGRVMIMMRLEKRRFVERVDYVTSPGYIDGPNARSRSGLVGGGPAAVISDKAIFEFDEDTKEMYLSRVYPGVTTQEIKREVGWDLRIAKPVRVAEPPGLREVRFIRGYDPTDVILRSRRLFEDIDFSSWVALTRNSWRRFTPSIRSRGASPNVSAW